MSFRNKMRTILSLALAIVMTFSLAACNSGGSGKGKSAKKVTLVEWYVSSTTAVDNAKNKMISDFEAANPNIKIDQVAQSGDNYDELLKAADLAHNGPDIQDLWPGSPTTNYIDYLVPLNKYLSAQFMSDRFGWDLTRKGLTTTGNVYGIPMDAYVYCVWYNKDLLAKVGVSDSNTPKTWDDLLSVCAKLKDQKITPFILGSKDGYIAQWGVGALMCTLMGDKGASEVTAKGFKFEGSQVQTAIELWQELSKNGYINTDNAELAVGDDQDKKFALGQGAMLISGNWEFQTLSQSMGSKLSFFTFPAADPNNPNKDYNYAGPGLNLCISNYSKNIDQAVSYIKYAASNETYLIGEDNQNGQMPTLKTIDTSKITNPYMQKFSSILNSGNNAIILDLVQLDAYNSFVKMGSEITNGKMSAKDACIMMDKAIAEAKQ
jgi:raffinose/stachyose/melibiose transport system substrate-binding protein